MLPIIAVTIGFVLLLVSADRFVEGAAASARHLGVSPLLIGVIIVGFGTSAPEMVVSALAALDGNPALALGNALGSNIVNTGLILGTTALVAPISVSSGIVRRELPLLLLIGAISGLLLIDSSLSRPDGLLLLAGFFGLVGWTLASALRSSGDALGPEIELELVAHAMSLRRACVWLAFGLALMLLSSRLLVWGAVEIAIRLGISDLVVGLTIVALGTSLPELAASVIAARKNEPDIALGNIVGSNMFNLLAVVGIATVIEPSPLLASEVLYRDWPTMMLMMGAMFVMAYGFRGPGRINRLEGGVLLASYFAYNTLLVMTA
jgi:cation:H+ antiporter